MPVYVYKSRTPDNRENITVHVHTQVLHCLDLVPQSAQDQPLPLLNPLLSPPTTTGSTVKFNHKANLQQQMQASQTLFGRYITMADAT